MTAVISMTRRCGLAVALVSVAVHVAGAQWSTTYEQFYLQARHNWEFRNRYQGADRLFNAFDYGHAILYETLLNEPNAPASRLEEREYDRLTRRVLVKPPRVPLEEAAIEINYARLVPEAKQMFDWAHILHRQIYDVWSDESIPLERKDAEVARLIAYYRTRPDLAFSSRPKTMELMQEQPFSLAFRQKYPKFNGLIWAYHWLQVGLYEPLVVGATPEDRQTLVRATVARFWQMLRAPTRTMPYQMPMTAAIAPEFARRYEEAAIIFDNLHSMHDVVSDILANPSVPRDRKRAEILRAARLFRDDSSYVMPVAAWRTMSVEMGVENMGGPAVGFLPELPTPTVTYGAVMTHDNQSGKMTGVKVGQLTGAMAGMDHSAMGHGAAPPPPPPPPRDTSILGSILEIQLRILADTGVRRRLLADSAIRRMLVELLPAMPADQRARMSEILRDTSRVPPPDEDERGAGPRVPRVGLQGGTAAIRASLGPDAGDRPTRNRPWPSFGHTVGLASRSTSRLPAYASC